MNKTRQPLLQMENISKSFGGAKALQNVRFDLYPGEVHALMGENGAGKSTLMKILSGGYQPDTGTISIAGEEHLIANPRVAAGLGIAIIHQELNTVPHMTVAENLSLGVEPTNRFGVLDRKQMITLAQEKLDRIKADVDPRKPMGSLSVGQQQMVEIARAVAEDARVLVLDEPTAALSEGEAQQLFRLINEMRANGMAMAYISHRMEEVWRLSDRITVFRDGQYVATSDRGELSPEEVVHQMIGRDVDDLYVRDDHEMGPVRLEVKNLVGNGIGPVSFAIHSGEVVGMVGLVGAGRTEIARLIAGSEKASGGVIEIDGKPVQINNPVDAIKHRVGMLPESRKEQANFPDLSITDNISMASLDKNSTLGILNRKGVHKAATRRSRSLRIRATSLNQEIRSLSGGNQQKAILARWLEVGPRILILDEPTRGVDIGAKHEIYRIINQAARDGAAVLVISSDLPEALGISDRVLVVRDGEVVQELDWTEADEEKVMLYATGVASSQSSDEGTSSSVLGDI